MGYTTVLEAVAERIESSSLSLPTKIFGSVDRYEGGRACKALISDHLGLIPSRSTEYGRLAESGLLR